MTSMNRVQRAVGRALVAGMTVVDRIDQRPEFVGTPLAAKAVAPDPVILVPGAPDGGRAFDTWMRSFQRDGVPVYRVSMPGRGMSDVRTSAQHLSREVDRIRRQYAADKVALVGYSQGGLVARAYVELLDGARAVDALVTVATPNHGSTALGRSGATRLARGMLPPGITDQAVGSQLFRDFEVAATVAADVRYSSVYVDGFDGIVLPVDSPRLAGAVNIPLARHGSTPTHLSIVRSSAAAYEAARAAVLLR